MYSSFSSLYDNIFYLFFSCRDTCVAHLEQHKARIMTLVKKALKNIASCTKIDARDSRLGDALAALRRQCKTGIIVVP